MIFAGITAAKCQTAMLMHMEYKVSLPDHDWVVASRHKLIPSVYVSVEIERNSMGNSESIKYSGPVYISVRSGKHSSSSAASHSRDLKCLVGLQNFEKLVKTEAGTIKPIIIIMVDGGPDENPRYSAVIACAIDRFKEWNLDGLFVATNAPGRSAFNRVERIMAPFSRSLSGVILSHNHEGNHLDSQMNTVDEDLEKKNFACAGKILADIWK